MGQSLERIVNRIPQLKPVYKKDLEPGDRLLIYTLNSIYSIEVLGEGFYHVSGGWFSHRMLSPHKTTITGCSWGSSIILMEVAAARGLCLEFGNRVVTSPIRKISLIKSHALN